MEVRGDVFREEHALAWQHLMLGSVVPCTRNAYNLKLNTNIHVKYPKLRILPPKLLQTGLCWNS